jgi:hypothetical protein
MFMTDCEQNRGVTAVEVVFITLLLGVVTLVLLLAIPRSRESARRVTCQRNLMQIGNALALYTEIDDLLPPVRLEQDSPVAQMLIDLKQTDFLGLSRGKPAPRKAAAVSRQARVVAGFMCPSDPGASDGHHSAPISYRANTGDTLEGTHGPFAIGKEVRLSEIEAGRGRGFVAAFSERLVGNGRKGDLSSYDRVAGPLDPKSCDGEGELTDAGSSWLTSTWTSTLYNHVSPPRVAGSCIANDNRSARMGTSSGHAEGVHVLMLDGSAKLYRPTVNLQIWQGLGNFGVAAK